MSVGQTSFTSAILDPALAVPAGLSNPDGAPATKRFDVYRNNVAVSLSEALSTAFPVITKLVGAEFFNAMAGIYLRAHPPSSPLMMFYGEEMPTFLAGFEPVAHIPYLPDMARLELALRHSYHAADAAPVSLEGMQPDALVAARLTLAPALRVIRSDWPIHAIYRANTEADAPKPQMQAEDVLITRPEFDPMLQPLTPGAADFIAALQDTKTLGEALDHAASTTPTFDLSHTLGLLIAGGAIVGCD